MTEPDTTLLVLFAFLLGLFLGFMPIYLWLQGRNQRLRLEVIQHRQHGEQAHTQLTELNQRHGQTSQQLADLQSAYATSRLAEQHAQDSAANLEAQNHVLSQRLAELETQHGLSQSDYLHLSREHSALTAQLTAKEAHFAEQLTQLEHAKASLSAQFENIANRLLEEKSQQLSAKQNSSLHELLQPFREQVASFQTRVNQVHDAAQQGHTELRSHIQQVLDVGIKMRDEASNLAQALKGDAQQRGAWGEAQLRRTLEASGLIENQHYSQQDSFLSADGQRRQTDFLIHLPEGKNLIIDSKVTLKAYDRLLAAGSNQQASQDALKQHLAAVRRHMDDLASKDYSSLPTIGSPDFVLMFMPIEPAYIEALKHDPDLFDYGWRKNIILVSHTTLLPILRTISNLWAIEQSRHLAQELSQQAGDIFKQISRIAQLLEKVGGNISALSNNYNQTLTALTGRQGLYPKLERLGAAAGQSLDSLPQPKHQASHLELHRLQNLLPAAPSPSAPETPAA